MTPFNSGAQREEYVSLLEEFGVEYGLRRLFKACEDGFPEYAVPSGAGFSLEMGFLQIYRANGAGIPKRTPEEFGRVKLINI